MEVGAGLQVLLATAVARVSVEPAAEAFVVH